jgi:ribosomal protein S18 acetylase RimI-like enzyme
VLIQESLYLNLIAVHKDFQSKGIGRNFFDHSVKLIYENNFKFEYISCESHKAALDFYLNKVNFRLVGKKMRIFRNWYVLLKKY